jgi:hypothetical protein
MIFHKICESLPLSAKICTKSIPLTTPPSFENNSMTKSNVTAFSFTKSTTYSSKTKNSSETSSPKVRIILNSKTKDWKKKLKKENASATSPNTWSTSSQNSKDKTHGSDITPPVSTKNPTPSTDRNHVTFLNIAVQIPSLHLLIFIHLINHSLSQLRCLWKDKSFLISIQCLWKDKWLLISIEMPFNKHEIKNYENELEVWVPRWFTELLFIKICFVAYWCLSEWKTSLSICRPFLLNSEIPGKLSACLCGSLSKPHWYTKYRLLPMTRQTGQKSSYMHRLFNRQPEIAKWFLFWFW